MKNVAHLREAEAHALVAFAVPEQVDLPVVIITVPVTLIHVGRNDSHARVVAQRVTLDVEGAAYVLLRIAHPLPSLLA
jgi:hypothetical protein